MTVLEKGVLRAKTNRYLSLVVAAVLGSGCDEPNRVGSDASMMDGGTVSTVDAAAVDARDGATIDVGSDAGRADATIVDTRVADAAVATDAFAADAVADGSTVTPRTATLGSYDAAGVFHSWADGERLQVESHWYELAPHSTAQLYIPVNPANASATGIQGFVSVRSVGQPGFYDPENQWQDFPAFPGALNTFGNIHGGYIIENGTFYRPSPMAPLEARIFFGDDYPDPGAEQETVIRVRLDYYIEGRPLVSETFEQRVVLVPHPLSVPRAMVEIGRHDTGTFTRLVANQALPMYQSAAGRHILIDMRVADRGAFPLPLEFVVTSVSTGVSVRLPSTINFTDRNMQSLAENIMVPVPGAGRYRISASFERLQTAVATYRSTGTREIEVELHPAE